MLQIIFKARYALSSASYICFGYIVHDFIDEICVIVSEVLNTQFSPYYSILEIILNFEFPTQTKFLQSKIQLLSISDLC